jgi:hypothetical protein
MFDWRSHSPALTLDQALARLSVVLFIELVGFLATLLLVKYGPGWFSLTSEAEWQRDCLQGIYFFGGASLITLIVVMVSCIILPRVPNIPERIVSFIPKLTEGMIWLVFGMNTVFFTLGMARTGGPSQSFFAQLVPIQLSGILVLQQQKVMISEAKATIWTFATFATFSILAWLVVVSYPAHVIRIVGWNKLIIESNLETFFVFATTALFVLSVAVTVLAYWLPLQRWFTAIFQPRN